jgi:dimethylamine/trimethylamine dehydrogenase
MADDASAGSPYDVLFEPVRIGPLTTRNRFYQVPHCNGMGYRDPTAQAEMRRVKAEGGWGVVCTEQVEIHPSSDIAPFIELRIWDERDLPVLARIADAIHEGGALAGIELAHNGMNAPNLYSREVPMGPSHLPVAPDTIAPVQARAMTRDDIADLRRWHRTAVRRSLSAGYDIVYVYAAHGYSVLHQFLSPRWNLRDDEYGGSVTNRMRLLRELLEDTMEEVDGRAAVACRIAVDEEFGAEGAFRQDIEQVLGALGEIPDLWDFAMGSWEACSVTSRFGPESGQERHVAGLKALTSKPVVGVGRFTSPDEMVRQVRSGVLDLVGAARPSIADPFLPNKIRDGRLELIRECIGCNICVSGDQTMSVIRCTQNPSMGEEYRRGWHPERIRAATSTARVAVVGSGPAGLEATRALGARGYHVTLLEGRRALGGRVTTESLLPGLSAWNRVRDHREVSLTGMPNVEVYRESPMTADDLVEAGFEHVVVATGARWRGDGIGRWHTTAVPTAPDAEVLTPDDLFAGRRPRGPQVLVYDDDHYYLGGVLAELLRREGFQVTVVTPEPLVSAWTAHTFEVRRVQRRLTELGITRCTESVVTGIEAGSVLVADVYTASVRTVPADSVVVVTARLPNEELLTDLAQHRATGRVTTVRAVGDCLAPGTIAAAVWSGRRAAEEFDEPAATADVPFRREITALDDGRPQ